MIIGTCLTRAFSLHCFLFFYCFILFQTIAFDLCFQTILHPARRELRPQEERLLLQQLVPLQPVGLELQVPPGRPLPEMGLDPLARRPITTTILASTYDDPSQFHRFHSRKRNFVFLFPSILTIPSVRHQLSAICYLLYATLFFVTLSLPSSCP